jgi:hypothetical protein
MDLWLPGYEHDPERGAGLSVSPGAPKVVIHTTESGYGSLDRIRDTWRGPEAWGRGLPHFIAEGDRYVQLLPLNVGAYTLENAPGGADTNRSGPAIQVEIVGYARNAFTDVEYAALGRWLADLVKAGVRIDLSQHPQFHGEGAGWVLAAYDARQRMTAGTYSAFNGFCGHQHCPENAHWDPGFLDADRVERIALGHLGTTLDKEKVMANGVKLPDIPESGNRVWVSTTDGVGRPRCYEAPYPDGTSALLTAGVIDGIVELTGGPARWYYNTFIVAAPVVAEWTALSGNLAQTEDIKAAIAASVTDALDGIDTPELPASFAADVAGAVLAKIGPTVTDAAAAGVDRELDKLSD